MGQQGTASSTIRYSYGDDPILMLQPKNFPHWLSALWIFILLAVGWGPLAFDDLLQHAFPQLNADYQGSAFAITWGLTATLFCTILAAILIAIHGGRIVMILGQRFKSQKPQ